jgi:thiol-disulfide isomerase/thioredoxin
MISHYRQIAKGVILALMLSTSASAGEFQAITGAPPAPPLELADPSGNNHALGAHRGRVVLVNFWASWCSPCLQEMPSLQRLADAMANQPLTIFAVNVGETPGRAQEALRRLGYKETMLLDRDQRAFANWGVKVLPSSFLIDGEGRLRFKAVGALEWDAPEVEEAIEALVGAGPSGG